MGDRYRESYLEMNLGLVERAVDDVAAAERRLERSVECARRIGDVRGECWATGHLATIRIGQGDYSAAEALLAKALALADSAQDAEREAEFRNNLGSVLLDRGRFRDAGREYEATIAFARSHGYAAIEARALHNLGIIQQMLGDVRAARATLESCLLLAKERDDAALASYTESNLANVLFSMGETARAESLHHAALAHDIAAGDTRAIAADIDNLARVMLARGDYTAAADTIDAAIRTCEERGHRRVRLYLLMTRAEIFRDVNELDDARIALEAAALGAREMDDLATLGLAEALLGEVHALRGDFGAAASRFETATRALEETGDALGLAAARNQQAHAHLLAGDTASARSKAESALETSADAGAVLEEARALWILARAATARGATREAETLLARAAALLPRDFHRDLAWQIDLALAEAKERAGDGRGAAAALLRGIETVESLRGGLLGQRERARYVEDKEDLYRAMVSLLLASKREAEAFEFAERARSRAFLDLLVSGAPSPAGAGGRSADGAAAEARQRIATLSERWASLEEGGIEAAEAEAAGAITAGLRDASAEYERAVLPMLERGTSTAPAAKLGDVRAALSGGEALLDYFFARDGMVIFLATPAGTRTLATSVTRESIADRVRIARALLQNPASDRDQLDAVLTALGETLLGAPLAGDALADVRRLYVVPHADLHHLPFAPLVTPGPRSPSSGDARYLIDRFEIVSLPAASLLTLAERGGARDKRRDGNLLVVGGVDRAGSAALPYSEDEARLIADAYAGLRKAEVLTGPAAEESAWKARCADAGRIHIAAHGRQNRASPLLAALELAPAAGEDGLLEAHEVMRLGLHADLAVLSGCETALGSGFAAELPRGDEIVSLARAFLTAGASSVVATLWPVVDRASADFMVEFHRNLAGFGPAGALARTQRHWARQENHRAHPFYWAGPVLLGCSS
jgi:CHAT domain-containing protein